jgi:hypothetical protein
VGEIRERPILFSSPMVRAILAGQKTMTRRIVKPQPEPHDFGQGAGPVPAFTGRGVVPGMLAIGVSVFNAGDRAYVRCPFGVGQRLWVRETWGVGTRPDPAEGWRDGIEYRADEIGMADTADLPLYTVEPPDGATLLQHGRRWRPSIHMPRWASRLTLEVTSVRVERLQGISEEDAQAEGLRSQEGDGGGAGPGFKWRGLGYHGGGIGDFGPTFHVPGDGGRCRCLVAGPSPAQCAFRELWDQINGERAPWRSNPWVWAVAFKAVPRG